VVILVHGLGGDRWNLGALGTHLAANNELTVLHFGYASTRGRLEDHAAALALVVKHLGPEVSELSFVGHSMGNLVVRRMLHDAPPTNLKRIVMIAPPNHGAELADSWGQSTLFLAVAGGAAHQLGEGWKTTEPALARPDCEFGVIAGGRGNDRGFSRRLPGDDDLMVTVSSTRLAGACDFLLVPTIHPLLPLDNQVKQCTLRFLEQGCFLGEDQRMPVEADGN